MNITKLWSNNNYWIAILLLTFTIQSNVFGTTIIVGTPPKKEEQKSMFEPDSDSGYSQTDLDQVSNSSVSSGSSDSDYHEELYIPNEKAQEPKTQTKETRERVRIKRLLVLTPTTICGHNKRTKLVESDDDTDDGYNADDERLTVVNESSAEFGGSE